MTITAIVSTKDRLSQLGRCLATIEKQTRKPEELVVIDAAEDPRVRELVESQKRWCAAVSYHPMPSSLTQARNFGVAHSTGEVVVFLDDDLLLEPDFIREVARPIEEDAGVAGVTGDIVNHLRGDKPFNRLLKLFFLLPMDGDGRFRVSGAPTMAHGLREPQDVEFLPGGLTAWRRDVFSEFSFDEDLPGLGVNEDVDFSYRVSRKWRNRYNPKARGAHERPSLDREGNWRHLRMEYSSLWLLYKKNQPKDPLHLAAFLWQGVGVLVRFFFRRWLRN